MSPPFRVERPGAAAVSLSLSVTFLAGAAGFASAAEPRRPNVVVFLADDLGYADVGFQGCEDIPTPHLDALAAAGVRCTDGYASCPVCCPTRAGLLTGRYQNRFGYEFLGGTRPGTGLPPGEATVAESLKSAGYATGAIGKWHLGQEPQFRPLNHGFGEFFGFLGGGRSYLPLKESVGVPFVPKDPDAVDLFRGVERVADPPYLTEAFGREAVAFVERHKERPFFLYVAFNAVHVPLQATPELLSRVPGLSGVRRTYAAMLVSMDDAVGAVREKLRAERLEEETLVFFLSDNGGHPMASGARNTPLRREKGTVYEGGVRVPFVVSWPGRLPRGATYSRPVMSIDVAPTALAAAGGEPQGARPDGVNLIPHLAGETAAAPHEALYWNYGDHHAVRVGDWKLTMPADGEPGLYDLATDIGESRDLSAAQPGKLRELGERFAAWEAELPPPAWPAGMLERKAIRPKEPAAGETSR